jgi:trehalose/maltose hydrolase-like predicted phosphorylase
MENGVTKEHAGFAGEGIKQADVNLLAYPLKEITDKNQIRKDLEYYETRVPNEGTPAMTQPSFHYCIRDWRCGESISFL